MMKKYVFVILLLFMGSISYAQSLTFEELQNMTNLTDDQVHNFLLVSKNFKAVGKHLINGESYEAFRSNRIDPAKAETVYLGRTDQITGGNIARQVFYNSLRIQDINSMLIQAKRSTMSMVFVGADKTKDIYRFDNTLFMSIITIGLDKSYGTVQVQEK